MNEKAVLNELKLIRNDLYSEIPVGNVDAFSLIKVVKKHIERLDEFIELIEKSIKK